MPVIPVDRIVLFRGEVVTIPQVALLLHAIVNNEGAVYPDGKDERKPMECGTFPNMGVSIKRGKKAQAKGTNNSGAKKLLIFMKKVLEAKTLDEFRQTMEELCTEHIVPMPDLTFVKEQIPTVEGIKCQH